MFFFPPICLAFCAVGEKILHALRGIPDIEKSKILILCGKENVKGYIYIYTKG